MVLEYKDDPPASLAQIVSSGDLAAFERHLSSGRSIFEKSPDGQSLLHLCALSNDRTMAQCLLDHDTENALINAKNGSRQTAFTLAVEEESIEVASLLIERGCALGGFINTMMEQLEAGTEDEETRKLLKPLAMRLNASSHGPFLVRKAVIGNQPNILKTLLDSGFDPNEKDEHGVSFLFS
jgi:ankyrin repeat protein